MKPSVGRIVHYRLDEADAERVNRRRPNGEFGLNVSGCQVHVGNEAHEGDVAPMIIVRVNDEPSVNGQVLLDGNDTLWVTGAYQGDEPGEWSEPPRV